MVKYLFSGTVTLNEKLTLSETLTTQNNSLNKSNGRKFLSHTPRHKHNKP